MTRIQARESARDILQIIPLVMRTVAAELRAAGELPAPGHFGLLSILSDRPRMLTDLAFERGLQQQWEAIDSIGYNLHPPLLRAWGMTKKLQLGEWFRVPLRILASLKGLRGTPLDPFGYSALRKEERALVGWYKDLVERAIACHHEDPALAMDLVTLPDQIRGYENIRLASITAIKNKAIEFLQRMPASPDLQFPR